MQQRLRDLRTAKDSDIAGLQEKIHECRELSGEARETITQLAQNAGVVSNDELRIAIQRSEETRKLGAELHRLTNALTQDGDGLSIAKLDAECSGSDLDVIAAKDQTVTEEVQELRNRLMEAREAVIPRAMPSRPSAVKTGRRGTPRIGRRRLPR